MGFMSLTYRRPSYVDKPRSRGSHVSDLDNEKGSVFLKSGRSGNSAGIPAALSFEKIVDGGTCPVSCKTLRANSYTRKLTTNVSPAPSATS
jgi:hypothetical protein